MEKIEHMLGAYYYNAGIDLIENNNISCAADCFKKSLEYYSDNTDCLNALGLCSYILGLFDSAFSLWEKSFGVKQDANMAENYLEFLKGEDFRNFADNYNKAIELIERGKYIKALRILRRITNNASSDIICISNAAGLLYYKLGLRKSARNMWKKVLLCDCGNKQAFVFLKNA